uniref:Protein HID1 n=1 Tax=Daphnia magna TaxID=35525 RepID=A0A0P5QYT1_9CRUS
MGNADTKLNFRKAVVQLTTKIQPVDPSDDAFWSQFWSESITNIQDVFTLIPATEIRVLREECPSNLATLCYKAVERLVHAADSSCATQQEHCTVINCVRILTRLLPYIFEDPDWRSFFWSSLPSSSKQQFKNDSENPEGQVEESIPLAQSLLNALCDLLFCPDFTVYSNKKFGPDKHEDLHSIDSCEFIWEAGVGFAHAAPHDPRLDNNRNEILKLLLTCFSQAMYHPPGSESEAPNKWVQHFTSPENRHALPLFTSLLNVLCAYDPVGLGLPYNHLLFTDSREPLVETALQLLIVTLDWDSSSQCSQLNAIDEQSGMIHENLFINYLSRIHREEDFAFMLHGFTRLLKNPLIQTYLPNSNKKVQNHQELLVFFWKVCDFNKKFLYYVLKSSDVLDVLVPILFHLNDSRADQSRVGLMHIGVFILLLLSGERNFGVRLNKPYTATVPMDIPVFTGTHADLLVVVFHKIITTGHQRLQPLFDCLLTILVNVSPYLKTLSMVASTKLLHLLEAFSTPWFLFSAPNNHHLVFFLLEIFNNIIQYQFDGNANLVYTIIRKRHVFHALASLPTDCGTINRSLSRRGRKQLGRQPSVESVKDAPSMEGSHPALPAQPGTHTCSLAIMPGIEKITEQETAHPSLQQLSQLTGAAVAANGAMENITVSHEIEERATILAHSENVDEDSNSDETEKDFVDQGAFHNEPVILDVPDIKEPISPTSSHKSSYSESSQHVPHPPSSASQVGLQWLPNPDWVLSWKQKLPLQTIMRLLQVLVPQVEKICIDKGLTDESEILKFLQHGTLVGLLPVPHPILIRKYQANNGTSMWFRTYMWGIIYLRNVDPPIWYDTAVKLFEIQRI